MITLLKFSLLNHIYRRVRATTELCTMKARCLLVSCTHGKHKPIPLPHKEPVVIGRSSETNISDKHVSKKQVELTANCRTKEVAVKTIGRHPSMIDHRLLPKGKTAILKQGVILRLCDGKYPYRARFMDKGDKDDSFISSSPKESPQKSEKTMTNFFQPKGTKQKQSDDDKGVTSKGTKQKHEDEEGLDETKSDDKRETKVMKRKLDDDSGSITAKRVKLEDRKEIEEDEDLDEEMKEIQRKLLAFQNTASSSKKPKGKAENDTINEASPSVPSKRGSSNTEDRWEQRDTLLMFTAKGVEASSKIAGFDIDGCIITTQSGKVFPTHIGDWKLLYSEIPGKLKKLQSEGYKIVFFTNQMGIQRGKLKIDDFKGKIHNILRKLNIPVQVFISTGKGPYRKPGLGMWKYLTQNANDGVAVDMNASVYVGDAAGRPADWEPKKKKDFSCSDRLFALNAGLKFYTPEEFFLGHKPAKFNMPEFDPHALSSSTPLLEPSSASIRSDSQEIVVLVGYPASGKSYFARTHFVKHGYVHISRDKLGNWQKCVAATTKAIKDGKSAVIDNTNPDEESRKRYTDVGKAHNIPCRCFLLQTSLQHARHNERFREMTDKSHQPISDMVMNSYKSKYKEPSLSENFTEIVKVNFVPEFKSPEEETQYRTFILEK